MNPERITRMASAFYESCVLFAASDLGVFSELAKRGDAGADELAAALGVDGRGLTLLLDACVAVDLLAKQGDRYRNSDETTAFLVPGAPADLSGAIRYNRDVYAAWGQLPAFVRTGKPVERPETHLGDDPDRTRAFVMSMHGRALAIGRAVVPTLPLDGCRRMLDVGGGPGTFSAMAARSHPELACTVIDLPAVAAIAAELLAAQGLADRVTLVPGDYRSTAFPAGQDLVLFAGVLHQESPDSIRELLSRANAALVPGGRVCILDMMTDATHTRPAFSALFAVNMALTTAHGWVFSGRELGDWLRQAGFDEVACRPMPPPLPHWLTTARKAG
jgi:ubiquinone/menaquinone biosynthesis C-methylase UbiE